MRSSSQAQSWDRHPPEPIVLTIKPGREDAPLPSFLAQPVPLLSEKLYSTIRSAGVDNIDVYRAHIRYGDGRLASDAYCVFNLIGVVKAADLAKSKFDPHQLDRTISMNFDAVAIDSQRAGGALMFRLEENLPTI